MKNEMKIDVYQSFRTDDVPNWIVLCLDSVKQWAGRKNYDYKFYGDEFLDLCPAWYRKKVTNQIHLVADLSRLILAKKLLNASSAESVGRRR